MCVIDSHTFEFTYTHAQAPKHRGTCTSTFARSCNRGESFLFSFVNKYPVISALFCNVGLVSERGGGLEFVEIKPLIHITFTRG